MGAIGGVGILGAIGGVGIVGAMGAVGAMGGLMGGCSTGMGLLAAATAPALVMETGRPMEESSGDCCSRKGNKIQGQIGTIS